MSENSLNKSKLKTQQITTVGILFAVTIILGSTGLGFIPIPPINTTIMHIPVIIGSLIAGPVVGGLTGLLFGIFSMFRAMNLPSPVSFLFMNPIIALIPRILIGVTPYLIYKFVKTKSNIFNLSLACAIGSFTNTIGVMGLIYILYIDKFANALHISLNAAKTTILAYMLNGFVSASVAIVISVPVVMAVKKTFIR